MVNKFFPRIVMAPAEEVSASNAPETKSNYQDIYDKGDPNETFDNMEYESPTSKKVGEDYKETFKERIDKAKKLKAEKEKAEKSLEDDEDEEEEKPKKKAEKKEDKKEAKPDKKKSDIDTLSDKEDGVEDEDEEAEEDEDKEDKKAKAEEKDEEEEKPLDKAKTGKVKIRMDGELYGVDPTATVRHKVDGEWVETSIQDLINKGSGSIAYDKKFTELGNQKKAFEAEKIQVTKKAEVLTKTVGEIMSIINDPNAKPQDALFSLVEKAGGDLYTLERRLIESNLETLEKLMEMSEPERKAYWLERKDEIRTKADKARQEAYEKSQSFNQAIQKLDALRQAHGVSEDQYVQALDDLEAQKVDTTKMTDEQVVDYASLKPHLDSVQEVLKPYEEQIDDLQYEDVVRDFAKQLRAKKLSLEQLKEIAKKEFMDEDLKDLSSRTKPTKAPPKVEKKETKKGYESFDDFE